MTTDAATNTRLIPDVGPQLVRCPDMPACVLIAEDDPLYRRLLEHHLQQWGYTVEVCDDGAAAWRRLQAEQRPQLILLDWMMPGIDGVEICRRIRAHQHAPYCYVIVITSRSEKRDTIAALEAGADDYLSKPVDVDELRARIQVGARIVYLQNELVRSREQLRIQAAYDALTRVRNRRTILDVLNEEVSRCERTGSSVAVLMLDLDHFKLINDRFGHQAGDFVLSDIAARIVQSVRPYDKVGRYGGEEFLVVLPGCDAEALASVAERIRARVASTPVRAAGAQIDVRVSIGGACSRNQVPDPNRLVQHADRALYRAKSLGRDRCAIDGE